MSDSRHDIRSFFTVLLSTGANTILGFLSGLILIVGLDQTHYGLVSSSLAIVLVAQELVGRGINDSLIRLGTREVAGSRAQVDEVFRAGLVFKILFSAAMGLAFALFAVFPRLFVRVVGTAEITAAVPAIFATVVGYGLWSFVLTRYQARLEFRRLALVQPVNNALRTVLFLLFIAASALTWLRALWIYAGCLLLGATLFGVKDWIALCRRSWDMSKIRAFLAHIWRYSRWNLTAATAFVAYMRMDVLVLTRLTGKTDVAIYNASWQVLVCIDLCAISIMTVMIPKVCHHVCRRDLLLWMRRSMKLSGVGAIMSLPLFLLAGWYVPTFFGADYAKTAVLIRIVYFGSVLTLFMFPMIGILYAKEQFKLIACIHVFLLLASVPTYTWSVKTAGIFGAAWTTLGVKVAVSALLAIAVAWCIAQAPREEKTAIPSRDDE